MTVIDAYQQIYDSFPSGQFQLDAWRKYADTISPDLRILCEQDAKGYDFEAEILPVVQAVLNSRDQAEQIHTSFLTAANGLQKKVYEILKIDLDVTVVFYLGLCNGAGWATRLDGKPAVLLGIEKIHELAWGSPRQMKGLLYHELGHLWHFELRGGPDRPKAPRDKALWQLYSEGMAMYAEQLLCNDMDFYHQDKNGWLDWCKAHQKELFQEYLHRVDANESVQAFFGDWTQYQGVSDCGYYIGGELVKRMAQKYENLTLAKIDMETVYREVKSLAIGQWTGCG